MHFPVGLLAGIAVGAVAGLLAVTLRRRAQEAAFRPAHEGPFIDRGGVGADSVVGDTRLPEEDVSSHRCLISEAPDVEPRSQRW